MSYHDDLSGTMTDHADADPNRVLTEYGIKCGDLTESRLADLLVNHPSYRLRTYSGHLQGPAQRQNHGGYADIWLTQHPETGEWVAVKVMKTPGHTVPRWRRNLRILREAKAWANLRHENILELRGLWLNFGPADGAPCLVAPWCKDGNLRDHLSKNPSLSPRNRLLLVADVARGLRHLHAQLPQIVHGDIKSDNVLIRQGRACLCDFGISRVIDGHSGSTTGQHRYHRWSAPEIRSTGRAPPRSTSQSDVYALGCIFLQAITGTEPYFGLTNGAVHNVVRNYETPDKYIPQQVVGRLPRAYMEFMKSCWNLDPRLRPSATAALTWLEQCLRAA